MKNINQVLEGARIFVNDIDSIILNAIRQIEDEVLDLNRNEQLYRKGQDAKGMKLRPYTRKTIEIKRAKGQPTNRTTLRDTKDFHNKFYIEYGQDEFEIKSGDVKETELKRKYGDDIFGLDDDSMTKLNQMLVEPLQNKLRSLVL